MKFNCTNILLYSLSLNILLLSSQVYNQRNHYITRTPKTNTRTLCECELYAPQNYDNDPEMKRVMQKFHDRTTQRLRDYDDRMIEKRKQCKERCDKEIQKIILKDKLEKELMDKFATLQTDIHSDAIPTCVCEKSLADKVEKECLKCAQNLGGIVAPSTGVLGEIAALAVNAWKTTEIAAATKAAIDKGLALGKIAGDIEGAAKVIELIELTFKVQNLAGQPLKSVFNVKNYADASLISESIQTEYYGSGCASSLFLSRTKEPICTFVNERIVATSVGNGLSPKDFIKTTVETMVSKVKGVAEATKAQVAAAKKAAILETSTKAIETTSYNWYTTIGYSITAILIIVLIMVIIYLILRYRRKKKMKKKLQYIKLLKE